MSQGTWALDFKLMYCIWLHVSCKCASSHAQNCPPIARAAFLLECTVMVKDCREKRFPVYQTLENVSLEAVSSSFWDWGQAIGNKLLEFMDLKVCRHPSRRMYFSVSGDLEPVVSCSTPFLACVENRPCLFNICWRPGSFNSCSALLWWSFFQIFVNVTKIIKRRFILSEAWCIELHSREDLRK